MENHPVIPARRPSTGAARRLIAAVFVALPLVGGAGASHARGLDDIEICHGFGCRIKESVSITGEEWGQIKAFFRPPAETAREEREQIKRATGWFEVIAGRHTPIHRDKGKNDYPKRLENAGWNGTDRKVSGSTVGQMDCIDESLNVTTYLTVMEKAGLLRHHRVVERAHRQSAVDQHYAGQIEEIETGDRWVVDSWFYDYGRLPYIEEAGEWHDIPFLFSTSFPE